MRLLAVASSGGHWIQMTRIVTAFEGFEIVYMSTNPALKDFARDGAFWLVPNVSRWDKLGLLRASWQIYKQVRAVKPDVIITTGAAPGLLAVFAGRILGIRTVWIDSIANVDRVSLSGRIATRIASRVYTQWSHLASKSIVYQGNVMS